MTNEGVYVNRYYLKKLYDIYAGISTLNKFCLFQMTKLWFGTGQSPPPLQITNPLKNPGTGRNPYGAYWTERP